MFTNPTFGTIRTAGNADSPLFCLADLCSAIGVNNARAVKSRLDQDDVSLIDTVDKIGKKQEITFVTESGMYDVIIRSDSPQSRPFRKWVTSEVLPAIRRTGGYIRQDKGDSEEDIMAKALVIAQKTIDNKKQRIQMLEGENEQLQAENKLLAPKAQYTNEVLQSTSTITLTEMAKELNFRSVKVFIRCLQRDKIMYRAGKSYLPYAEYSGKGLFATRTYRFYRSDGTPASSVITVVTQKGRAFFHNHFHTEPEPSPIDASVIIEMGRSEL